MSRPVTYNWPACNATLNEICRTQSVAAGGNLIINGTMASIDQSPTHSPQVMFSGISRDIRFTGTSAASNFTITGILNGKVISEVLNVVGGAPTASDNYYNIITSITSSAAVNGATVGMGRTGFTNWFLADFNRIYHQTTFSAQIFTNGGNLLYGLDCTLDDVNIVQNPFFFDPTDKFPFDTNGSMFGASQDPFLYARFACDDSGVNAGTASARFVLLQQGIT